MSAKHTVGTGLALAGAMAVLLSFKAGAQANMRRDGPLTLTQTSDDSKGFYSAAIDPTNGFAYFAAKYVYKVDVKTPLPTQVGAGVSLGRLAYSGVMDSASNCAYFAAGSTLYQILANGNGAPMLGGTLASPSWGSAFLTQLLLDTSDPANHYLYVMTANGGTSSTLYKLALGSSLASSTIIGSATTTSAQLGYGVIDLTNHCAYYGTYIPMSQPPYLAKFAIGTGANGPTNLGGIFLDTATNRSTGGIVLDIANGYGYCDSDGNDLLFGHARVYKWALNGTGLPTLASYVDMHTNEGYCHVAVIKPVQGLLYFSSDLSYPAFVYRFRLPPGTNAPVETGNIPLLGTTNTVVPAWGYNPTNASEWGEVFARSIAYDPIRDFAYIGRDCADQQLQPYTNQIVKVALDRDETMVALTTDVATTNNTLPYGESFESYTNGFSLVGTDGWYGEDAAMGLVTTNNYAGAYSGAFPIFGPHQNVLEVDGAVTNRFSAQGCSNVWADMIVEGKYWTDPIPLTLSNTPFAFCVTTNGHLAVWNCTNPPATGNGWTELTDTSIASNQFVRVTVEAAYGRDVNGEFYYRAWVNGVASVSPGTWYAAAYTNQNSFGDVVAQGHFALDDLTVSVPVVEFTAIAHNSNGSVSLQCQGMNGMLHRVWATTNVSSPSSWQMISTNAAGANGTWQFTDTNAAAHPSRFYRASLP
jgi:hypothetical protein